MLFLPCGAGAGQIVLGIGAKNLKLLLCIGRADYRWHISPSVVPQDLHNIYSKGKNNQEWQQTGPDAKFCFRAKITNGSNPVALVTGASGGIGEVFARRLSAQDYYLILVARRKERLEKLAAELFNAEVLAADLTNEADLHLVECRIAAEPRLEFLVNNAGSNIHVPYL
jgi:hypothetical protein